MNKKVLSILLAGAMAASVVAGSAISASAAKTEHTTYTPSEGVETFKYYFAMPGAWINDSTHDNDDVAGLYWWSADDNPDDVFDHGWPGYATIKSEDEEGVENLYYSECPVSAATIVWSNYLDGGMDVTLPVFSDAIQTANFSCEFYAEGDSDNYSQKFWDYMYENHEDDLDFSEFGIYADNFYDDTLFGSGIVHNFNNMVYVVNLDPSTIEIDYTMVPEGKAQYVGEFYFYYGNGKYGIWPTLDLAIEQEGLEFDEDGKVVGGNEYGQVFDEDGIVVYGSFTDKYWEDKKAPEVPTEDPTNPSPEVVPTEPTTAAPTTTAPADGGNDKGTVPAPDTNDASSSTSDSTQDSAAGNNTTSTDNGAVQTGSASLVVLLIVAVGAFAVLYTTRRRFEK